MYWRLPRRRSAAADTCPLLGKLFASSVQVQVQNTASLSSTLHRLRVGGRAPGRGARLGTLEPFRTVDNQQLAPGPGAVTVFG